jgi:L-lactate utilization protein LutB
LVKDEHIEVLISNLERRNIKAYYYEDLEEARNEILNMIPEDVSIGIGNSQTLKKMGISGAMSEKGNTVYDKTLAREQQEVIKIKKAALTADWYITGSNAISLEGHIVNIDHSGNRVAAMIFGPDNVVVVVGLNKIMPTLDEAVNRARAHAAPLNAKRAGYNPPCLELKKCVDCKTNQRVCYNLVVIEGQHDPDRMKVIVVNEELGF